jgi:hypothetical protein
MKSSWLMGFGVILGLQLLDPTAGFGGHGHARGSHAAKASHEAPKHSSGKPALHPAPKPSPKALSKPQLKSPPKPPGKPKGSHSHKPDLGKPSPQHESNHTRPGSGSAAQEQAAKNDKTHHNSHQREHHGWHHDRWWRGHHHIWSEEGYWVDAATGLPVVAADAAVPADGSDGVVAASPSADVAGRPQIHFSVDPSERETYDAAAEAAGISRAEWIRSRLNTAVHQELK